MSKQNIKDIYQIGTFKFRSPYKIKVSENTHSIGSDTKTIELLNPRDIKLLRDQSYKILHIGAIESNMAHGPVYFHCFPNLELSYIDDMSIHKALTLNVETKGYDMDPRAKNILIV